MLHIALHFIVPLAIAVFVWRKKWRSHWLWMLSGMVIDVDHLLADPIYDAARCSIGFHPLHSPPAMVFYSAVLLATYYWPPIVKRPSQLWLGRIRLFLIGVGVHLILDALDCVF